MKAGALKDVAGKGVKHPCHGEDLGYMALGIHVLLALCLCKAGAVGNTVQLLQWLSLTSWNWSRSKCDTSKIPEANQSSDCWVTYSETELGALWACLWEMAVSDQV